MTRRKWMMWAPAGALGAALGLTLIFTVPAGAASPAQHQHTPVSDLLPPPPQMRSLYAILGSYKCADQPPPGVAPQDLYVTSTKMLGGNYVSSDVEIPNVVRGQDIIGWDPVDGNYFEFYEDDWGSSGTATAPGWDNGHLIFKGSTIQVLSPSSTGHAQGLRLDGQNDYQVLGPGHYTDTATTFLPNGTSSVHIYDCHRL
jgi:hypothetical protein